MEQKLKESIVVFFAIATIAFIAGAENYYSEMRYEVYSPPPGPRKRAFHSAQNHMKLKISDGDSLHTNRHFAKK